MELENQSGIQVIEKHISVSELKTADSAFFTGTAAEVVGMSTLDDYKFPLAWSESLGKKLYEDYSLLVRNKFNLSKKAV